MNYYHVWVNLVDSHKDMEFAGALNAYLGVLKRDGRIAGFTLSRRKLGFGPAELGEFHVVIMADDLAQLDSAFDVVAKRSGEFERLHAAVYGAVKDFRSALYRDFPDEGRAVRE